MGEASCVGGGVGVDAAPLGVADAPDELFAFSLAPHPDARSRSASNVISEMINRFLVPNNF